MSTPWGGSDQGDLPLAGLEERFLANTAPYRAKLFGHKGRSDERLKVLPRAAFDFVYVDGSHEAADVLSDAVLAGSSSSPAAS